MKNGLGTKQFLKLFYISFIFIWILSGFFSFATAQISLDTKIEVTICGNAMVETNEECDFGDGNNNGGYSTTIIGRQCNPDCTWAPYCGDFIVQTIENEECDDGDNEDDDFCSLDCKAKAVIGPGGPTGSGTFVPGSTTNPGNTIVKIIGKAYPHSNVHILKDGVVIGIIAADSQADFTFTSANITPGTATFGVWSEDSFGLRSVALNVTFEVLSGSTTTVSGVFLPPTIDMDTNEVPKGGSITFFGQTVPEVDVQTEINSHNTILEKTISTDVGNWELVFDTSPLEEGLHTAKASFKLLSGGLISESSLSQAVSFAVGIGAPEGLTADLNVDGFVNLIDFSILLFHWNTDGGNSDPPADINSDGNVSLPDFSIMLFQWTG